MLRRAVVLSLCICLIGHSAFANEAGNPRPTRRCSSTLKWMGVVAITATVLAAKPFASQYEFFQFRLEANRYHSEMNLGYVPMSELSLYAPPQQKAMILAGVRWYQAELFGTNPDRKRLLRVFRREAALDSGFAGLASQLGVSLDDPEGFLALMGRELEAGPIRYYLDASRPERAGREKVNQLLAELLYRHLNDPPPANVPAAEYRLNHVLENLVSDLDNR